MSDFRRELLAQARAGKLGSGPTAWLAPTRPREELYDTQADPHQLKNLAADPKHAETLARMQTALRGWLVEIRDAAFLPEVEAHALAGDKSVYEAVRRPGAYPFERVLTAAEAVGDPTAVAKQRAWLSDPNAVVRYWAAVGFAANAAGTREARAELEKAMSDSSSAVRIETAGALLGATGDAKSREVLLRELQPDHTVASVHAARTLELLGAARVAPLDPLRTRHAKSLAREHDSQLERYIGFSLGALLKTAGEKIEPPRVQMGPAANTKKGSGK
jgi:hypothetical protein